MYYDAEVWLWSKGDMAGLMKVDSKQAMMALLCCRR
jgi:membrane-bound inhibitor of C-type lysozyme